MSDSAYNMYSLAVSSLALLLSVYTLFKSRKDVKFAQKNAGEALKLQHGTIELQTRTGITNARNTINNLTPILTPYLAKKQAGSLSIEDAYSLDLLYKAYDSCIEDLLNQYDEACKKYIDGKIDRAMFKETYFHEIKKITSSQDLSSYYNSETTKYTPTLRVREEWITD